MPDSQEQPKTQIPSNYRSVQIDHGLHRVPSHVVEDIYRMVRPYDEFRETIVAPLNDSQLKHEHGVALQELAKLNNELGEKNLRIIELEKELEEMNAGGTAKEATTEPVPAEGTPDDAEKPETAEATNGQGGGGAASMTGAPVAETEETQDDLGGHDMTHD